MMRSLRAELGHVAKDAALEAPNWIFFRTISLKVALFLANVALKIKRSRTGCILDSWTGLPFVASFLTPVALEGLPIFAILVIRTEFPNVAASLA